MSAVTNGDRCHRGENAIRAGAAVAERGPDGGRAYPEKPEDVIDALANIAHYCRRESLDFDDLCRIAGMHMVNETNGESAPTESIEWRIFDAEREEVAEEPVNESAARAEFARYQSLGATVELHSRPVGAWQVAG